MFPRYVICGDGKWNPITLNFVTRAEMLPSSRSEREPGSTAHPGVFSWAFLWLPTHLLMELNRCDLMDTVLSQTNSTSLPASTITGAKKWKILHRLFPDKTETQTVPGNWGQDGTQYETLSDKHVFIVLSFITDSTTTIKDPSLSQKGLKVTEWILIKTGVVNSSQHGLQWD